MSSSVKNLDEITFEAGRFVKVHGVNGRIVLKLNRAVTDLIDFPEWVFIRISGGLVPFLVREESVFLKDAGHLVIGLDEVTGQQKAAGYVGYACNLEEDWDEWFELPEKDQSSLTGYSIFDEQSGKTGIVTGFEEIPGNPLIEIEIEGKKALIPFHPEYIIQNDPLKRQLILHIPDGLLTL